MMNRPFLKWAGNKFKVLPELIPLIGKPKVYVEPFGGSLSVALNISAEKYVLNDINKDLVNLYRCVTSNDDFIFKCQEMFCQENNLKEKYISLRKYFNECEDVVERSRLFVYLNRHCFNGLSRYNSKGEFNVPFGKYNSPSCPSEQMMYFKEYFLKRKVSFTNLSFEDSALYYDIGLGDVVYFDPPYIPASDTANFTSYATEGFTHQQQVQLTNLAESLANRGAKVIISNHDTPVSRELYKNAKIYPIQVSRTISASGSSRKKANELIAVY